ncbi:hypothetical protein ACFOPQ_13370 [Deinococcus antarcticus]|uniref:Uncharacterized protein n=1 Tax=Deinococcus antarcticus TaxID=1298767 RepID=A0ABV8A938_9DEIO
MAWVRVADLDIKLSDSIRIDGELPLRVERLHARPGGVLEVLTDADYGVVIEPGDVVERVDSMRG